MAYTFDSIRRFMSKHSFNPENIIYILRENNLTQIHLLDGRNLAAKIPIGHFEQFLPQGEFCRVNKNVLLCSRHVVNVSSGQYLMTDGVTLEGRHHGTKCHTDFMRQMIQNQVRTDDPDALKKMLDRFTVFNDMPLPFCVIQLVFDIYGRGTTFIFRYCNTAMAAMKGKPLKSLVNRSFYDIFDYADTKWLAKYGDIARNGGWKVLNEHSVKRGKDVRILCYQVAAGFCGCLVLEDGILDLLADGKTPYPPQNLPQAD